MAAGEAGVHRVHVAHDADALAVHVGQEHGRRAVLHARHDDREGGAFGAGDEPLGAVDQVVVAVAHGGGGEHRRVGAGAGRGLGHAKQERVRPCTCGSSQRSFCASRGHRLHQVDVAFVGGMDVQRRSGRAASSRPPRTPPPWRRGSGPGRRARARHAASAARRRARARPARGAAPRPGRARSGAHRASSGMTCSAMKRRVRCCRSSSSGDREKSMECVLAVVCRRTKRAGQAFRPRRPPRGAM